MGEAPPPDDGGGEDASTNEGDSITASWLKDKGDVIVGAIAVAIAVSEARLRSLLNDPSGFIREEISGWVVDTIIAPMAGGIADFFGALLNAILLVAWGGDKQPFVIPPGGEVGILDFPLYVAELIIGIFGASIAEPVEGLVATVNAWIIGRAADAGLAAPFIVPLAWLALVAAFGYAVLFIARSIDVPLIDQGPTLDLLTAPVERLVGWLSK